MRSTLSSLTLDSSVALDMASLDAVRSSSSSRRRERTVLESDEFSDRTARSSLDRFWLLGSSSSELRQGVLKVMIEDSEWL